MTECASDSFLQTCIQLLAAVVDARNVSQSIARSAPLLYSCGCTVTKANQVIPLAHCSSVYQNIVDAC